MHRHALLSALLAALAIAPAGAQEAPAAGAAAAAAQVRSETASPDTGITVTGERDRRKRRVCRREVATGSIMAKTTCSTVGELEDRTASDAARLELMQQEQRRQQNLQQSLCKMNGRC